MRPHRLAVLLLLLLLLLSAGPAFVARGAEQPEQVWCGVCGDYVDATGGGHDLSNPRAGRCPRLAGARLVWNEDEECWRAAEPDDPEPAEEPEKPERTDDPAEAAADDGAEKADETAGAGTAGAGGAGSSGGKTGWREALRAVPAWAWLVAAGAVAALLLAGLLAPLLRRGRKSAPRFDVTLLPGVLVCWSEDIGDGGGTAEVHDAFFKRKRAVVKRMRNRGSSLAEKEHFPMLEYEAAVLRRLAPTRVVPELYVAPTRTELVDGPRVDVWEYYAMSRAPGHPWPEGVGFDTPAETRRALAVLCEALMKLHEIGIGHHDLKPRNVFWDGRRVTLLDFGSAVDHREGAADRLPNNPIALKNAGTPPWVPPARDGRVLGDLSLASDAWVYGLIFCEALSPGCISGPPWTRKNPERQADRDWLQDMVARESGSDELARWVVDGLFAIDKGRRPTLEKFLEQMRKAWRV